MTSEGNPPPPAAATHTAGILDLPTELLPTIFSHFCDHRVPDPEREDTLASQLHRDLIPNIFNIRLTCHLFADAAAEFLLSQVYVTLDQASLDKIDDISRHPTIFRGVRRVCVNLDYRPKGYAENLEWFVKSRVVEVKKFLKGRATCHFLSGVEEAEGRASGLQNRVTVEEFWLKEVNGIPDDRSGSHEEAECRRILREGFAAYRRGHEEQRRLVETGSFARGLASSIWRMPLFDSLIIDNQDGLSRLDPGRRHEASVEFLGSPFTWLEIEYPFGIKVGDLTPARLLFELPVAIHAAGAPLRRFMLRGLPIWGENVSLLVPVGEGSSTPAWYDLHAAFAGVEYVQLQGLHARQPHPRNFDPSHVWDNLDHYISALELSGRRRIDIIPARPLKKRILPHHNR